MASEPQLTIGVPIYNAAAYLEQCLATLCEVEMPCRILIADNASEDSTESIARSFAERDSRIVYLRRAENIGSGLNFVSVLESATTPFFAWRAHDDLSTPGYFERLTALLAADDDIDLAVGSVRRQDAAGRPTTARRMPETLPADPAARRRLLLQIASSYWYYGVFRREVLMPVLRRTRERFAPLWGQDYLLLLPYVLDASIAVCAEVEFIQTETGLSDTLHRPRTVPQQLRSVRDFCRHGFELVREREPSRWARWRGYWQVYRYADGRAEKYKRIRNRLLFWPYYRWRGKV